MSIGLDLTEKYFFYTTRLSDYRSLSALSTLPPNSPQEPSFKYTSKELLNHHLTAIKIILLILIVVKIDSTEKNRQNKILKLVLLQITSTKYYISKNCNNRMLPSLWTTSSRSHGNPLARVYSIQ